MDAGSQAIARRLQPTQDTVHYTLGLIYRSLGEEEQAQQPFQRFLELYWGRAYGRDYRDQAQAYLEQLP